jgi:hypothetical protein
MSSASWSAPALAFVAASAIAAVVFSGPLSDRLFDHGEEHATDGALPVSAVAGFTKVGFVSDYLVVVNVLPGEEMYTIEEVAAEQPSIGEMTIKGRGTDVAVDSRHVEAHIYSRETGLPVTVPVPVISVTDGNAENSTTIDSVLMQDVNVGNSDIHFGDNVVIEGQTDLRIEVSLGQGQKVTLDGRLD